MAFREFFLQDIGGSPEQARQPHLALFDRNEYEKNISLHENKMVSLDKSSW